MPGVGPCGWEAGLVGFPPQISPSPSVSGFPAPSCLLAPGSGPTAPAAFHVLISPLCSVALSRAPPPPRIHPLEKVM